MENKILDYNTLSRNHRLDILPETEDYAAILLFSLHPSS